MKIEQSIAIMKALADPSRLAIINSLLDGPQYVEELANRHALAPSTVSFHLRKLENAGLVSSHKEQYYVIFKANNAIFDTSLREIVAAHPVSRELQDQRMVAYQTKVLQTFFSNDRLEKLPAQHKKRIIILEQFAAKFNLNQRYTEQEVTALIVPMYDDYCLIRRLLIDEEFIRRDGTTYWRDKPGNLAADLPDQQTSNKNEGVDMQKTERSLIKQAYKQEQPEMGIYQIKNQQNGKIYVGKSRNLAGERNSRLFQLRMGKVPFSRELQKDLDTFGKEPFEFSILAVLDERKREENPERFLAALELDWLEKLQPFGEKGYNSLKSYQRDRERMQIRTGPSPA
jgi:hypothetical protein